MNLLKIIWLSLFLGVISFTQGQSYEVGQWIEHLSKREVKLVEEADGVIYAASNSSLFKYDTENGEFTTITTAEGLSDVNISALKYNKKFNLLLVGYTSGLIDFVSEDNVYTIVDVQQNSSINSKIVNNFHISGDTTYVACDFGLLVLDIRNKEIKGSYLLGATDDAVVVKDVTLGFDSIWVATDKGIYVASKYETNLYNYLNWSVIGVLPNHEYTFIEKVGEKLFIAAEAQSRDHVFIYSNGEYAEFTPNSQFRVKRLDKRGEYISMINTYRCRFLNDYGEFVDSLYFNGYQDSWIVPTDAVLLNNNMFFADNVDGLVKVKDEDETSIIPNSPYSNAINQILFENGKIYVAGGMPGTKYDKHGMYIYDDYWLNVNSRNNAGLENIPNINYVAFENGSTSKMYATSNGYGFMVFEDTTMLEFYNEDNSTLQNIFGYQDVYILTAGLQADEDVGAWVTVSGVPNPINYYNGAGEWQSFNLNSEISNSDIKGLIKTPWNHMWTIEEGTGVVVFDPELLKNGQVTNAYNRFPVKSGDGSTLTSRITTMEVDQDGYVWFGMDEGGLAVFYNASSALENNITASRIIVEQEGIAQYLLENERVSSIAVDAANRKWIGTETGGAFLISEDGTDQILNLNIDNTPMTSNHIRDIELDEENGIVYIGTDDGLFGYFLGVKESVTGEKKLKIFPNPVYENYNDLVRIEGLQDKMKLKITDVSGQIVFETTATGGIAYWNMKDFYNNRVSTGVYMFYASSFDGSQKASGKVFVVSQ
jgi:ligand-binding sensor domain-containing protein